MSYIDLIKKFWKLHNEIQFSTTEIALYFYLLEVNNLNKWSTIFEVRNKIVAADLNLSFPTFNKARNRLEEAGLIEFQTRKGSQITVYTLKNIFKVGSKNEQTLKERLKNIFKVEEETDPTLKETFKNIFNLLDGVYMVPVEKDIKTIYIDKEKACEMPPPIIDPHEKSIEACYEELKSNTEAIDLITLNKFRVGYKSITQEAVKNYLEKFLYKLQNEGVASKHPNDFRAHFSRWLDTELEKQKQHGTNKTIQRPVATSNSSSSKQQRDEEFTNYIAQKLSGT